MNAQIVNLADRRRSIVITPGTPGLWRGFEIEVQPPTSAHPLQSFHTHDRALAYAEELARVEGWPIFDRTSVDGPDGPRAA